ncbi:hypothetical protein E2C01_063419 [Portunus trituberculatus]|uniref:Uncharacterized protein n=1 Tax=Portunus trituberculatus TaxID=210409 RepID=A0A5B7HAE9_PORTR|nr:hypothetical protein [Portunus trituberculatus]
MLHPFFGGFRHPSGFGLPGRPCSALGGLRRLARVQEALQTEEARGGSLGHEPSSVRSRKCAAMADTPSFTKRSRVQVGPSVRPAFSLIELRHRYLYCCRVLASKAQLRCSDVDSDLQLDSASVEKAINQA